MAQYQSHPPGHGTTVFEIRLGLTILDLTAHTNDENTNRMIDNLYHRTAPSPPTTDTPPATASNARHSVAQ